MHSLLSICPRLDAAAVCTSAECPSRRIVDSMPRAVSGLTYADAPCTAVTPSGLDKATWKKFVTGKIRATGRLDLHGHTAARAHQAVILFVERAYAEQERCIEIITGNGEILVHEVPHWLNAPRLRPMILAIAHPHAANTGALRILLRRIR